MEEVKHKSHKGILLLVILILVAAVAGFLFFKMQPKEVAPVITSELVQEQLRPLGDLVTQEYIYRNADKEESNETWLFGLQRPLSGKSFIVIYDGTIKAGIDFSAIQVDVDETAKAITVTLPPSKITDNNIPQETIQVLEEKNGLFNEITLDDYNEFIAEQKTVMEQQAIDRGLLTKADEEARSAIKSFLSVLPGMDAYTLTVQ